MTSVTGNYRGPSISSEDPTGVGSRSTRRTDTDNLPTGQQWNTGKELGGNDDNAPTLSAAADWYPDPYYPNANILRYYDGRQWTRHTARQLAQAQAVVSKSPPQPYCPQVAAPQYVPPPRPRPTNKIAIGIIAAVSGAILVVVAVVLLYVWDQHRASGPTISNTPTVTTSQSWQAGHDWVTTPQPIIGNSILGNAKYIARSFPEQSASFCQGELNLYRTFESSPAFKHPAINESEWYQGCLAGMAENSTS